MSFLRWREIGSNRCDYNTAIGILCIERFDADEPFCATWQWCNGSADIGKFNTLDDAKAACEAYYIKRYTEFLPLVKPGECVGEL